LPRIEINPNALVLMGADDHDTGFRYREFGLLARAFPYFCFYFLFSFFSFFPARTFRLVVGRAGKPHMSACQAGIMGGGEILLRGVFPSRSAPPPV